MLLAKAKSSSFVIEVIVRRFLSRDCVYSNFKIPVFLLFQKISCNMDHDLVVCVDAWACIHLVMPTLFTSPDEWKNAACTRNDVPEEVWGDLSEDRLRYDKAFIAHIKNRLN